MRKDKSKADWEALGPDFMRPCPAARVRLLRELDS